MKDVYNVTENGIEKSEHTRGNLIIYKNISLADRQVFINQYNLPKNIFDFDDSPTINPWIEYLYNDYLDNTIIFVLTNLIDPGTPSSSEERLESHTFIYSKNQLFWFINDDRSNLDTILLNNYQSLINSLESIIIYVGLLSYTHFIEELKKQKNVIDDLNRQADQKTSRKVLMDIADTERNLVILEHTIDLQESAFTNLLSHEQFVSYLNNPNLIHDIKWYNRQVKNLVHVYRDLLDTVSSLFSDIMSNTLNMLMKFLSSLSLVLASSSLIAEIWGMNTGGLLFENHDYGTFIMILIVMIAGLSMYLYLRKKKIF